MSKKNGIRTAERLSVIETTLKYVQEGVDNIRKGIEKWDGESERIISEAETTHKKLQEQITAQKNRCDETQIRKESQLSGKEKALVYVAVITGGFAILAEFIRTIFIP